MYILAEDLPLAASELNLEFRFMDLKERETADLGEHFRSGEALEVGGFGLYCIR